MWEWIKFHPEIAIVGAITLIQIAPIKLDPWTMLAKWFRKVASGEIEERLSSIEKKIDRVENTIEEREAVLARTHILRFNDEIYNGVKHSKEYFDQQLEDIDRYDHYCERHPEFKNNRTVMASKNIKETYNRLLQEHKFL